MALDAQCKHDDIWFSRTLEEDNSMHDYCSDCGKRDTEFNEELAMPFDIKDSGEREQFESGMVRDTQEDKTDFTRVLDGPMFDRWAAHISKATTKYPDLKPGVPNWTLANGDAELVRFKKSAFRHFRQWIRGDVDEDHASAVFFNINGAEYVKEKLQNKPRDIRQG